MIVKTIGQRLSPYLWGLFAVYGPFFVAMMCALLFLSCDHCKRGWLMLVGVFPGYLVCRVGSQFWPGSWTGVDEKTEFWLGGLVSILIVTGVGFVLAKSDSMRWLFFLAVLGCSAVGAVGAFAAMRM